MKPKTTLLTKEAAFDNRGWKVIDATDVPLGRLSTKVAGILRGKHKAEFTPSVDCGDFVIVLNASKIKLTGNKWNDKKYFRHSGYMGSLKEFSARQMMERNPIKLVELAVKGMLPKTRLGRSIYPNLKVYAGKDHPHSAQQPVAVEMKK
jgi:large subunit ribosomal protein L13